MKNRLSDEIVIKVIILLLIVSIPITSLIKGFYSNYYSYMIKSLSSDEKTIVTIWSNDSYAKDIYARMIERYNHTKGIEENIEIQYSVIANNYEQVLEESLKNEVRIDLYKYPEGKLRFIKKGYMIPIEEISGGKEFAKGFIDDLQPNRNILQGKVYSLPHSIITLKLIYNTDIFKEVGIVDKNGEPIPPKTWEDVINYSQRISNHYNNKVYGYVIPGKWDEFYKWEIMYPAYSSIGHTGYDFKQGKYKYIELKPYIEALLKMKKNNTLFPGIKEIDKETSNYLFAEGKVAMKMAQSFDVAVFDYKFPAKYNWDVCSIPVINLNQHYEEYIFKDDSFVFSKHALNKQEEVMKVFEWINSSEFLNELYIQKRSIPLNKRSTKPLEKVVNISQWNVFCDSSKGKYMLELPDPNIISSGDYIRNTFLRILEGEADIDKALRDLDKRYNSALEYGLREGLDFSSYLEK